ncbi:hypothetical protein [Candidatus Uabimicrobium amorphum]|uniref:Uncharacterized protein n=1 Tax=Uabimicrobium amorphum TaxID=2596890 RepID=A0A5S9F2U6_UABAM|nr:hypothetical protein [Candidatus Uabimicrobium amorphum]BBM82839.1 hypothetical protein UABAM_01182 [Candidatus Uabimicrobium amorphum]
MRRALLFCFFVSVVFGDSPAEQYSYAKNSANDKYVFVMKAPDIIQRNENLAKYSLSGLYKNDGSATPLWMVNWYAFRVEAANDGQHLIRMGPWASSQDELAVAFYKNGRVVKQYLIEDLVYDESSLRYTVSHFMWKDAYDYDKEQEILTIKTVDGLTYKFAVNGSIVSKTDPRLFLKLFGSSSRRFTTIMTMAIVMIIIVSVILARRYLQKRAA